ncbi:hypothetical protein ABZW03_01545 [Kitasatospora sp. NPDC004799]
MSIEIALYDGRPNNGRRSAPTLLHLSTDHGAGLADCAATPGSWLAFLGD